MKRAILFAMIGFLILGWCMTGKDLVEKPAYFHKLISEAEKYESEKIYVRAIKSYKEALTYQPNSVEIKTKIAVDYLALGDESSFINRCNSINEEHGYPVSVATLLTDYFIEKGRNEKAIAVLQPAMKKHKNNEELLQRYEKIKYTYADMYLSYDQILPFRNDSAVYIHNGKYGLIDAKGKTKVREKNEWMGALSSGRDAAPACLDGEFFYVDDNGYRIEVPRQDQQVEELGVLCNDAAPAKINGKYGYVNVKFEEQSPFEWDDATVIQTGFGAVCKGENGHCWTSPTI